MCRCEGYLNKFCSVNYESKTVYCCFCKTPNSLPAKYAQNLMPGKLPFELMPGNSTFEFEQKNPQQTEASQAYMFVVDLCITDKELASVKEELLKVIKILPDDTLVGLVSFNKFVHVY